MNRNGPLLVALILVLGLGAGVVTALYRLQHQSRDDGRGNPSASAGETPGNQEIPKPKPVPALENLKPEPPEDSAKALENTGSLPDKPGDPDPRALVERIGRALQTGDIESVERLIGKAVLTSDQREQLRSLASGGTLRLRKDGPVREVGELEIGKLARWKLELDAQAGKPKQLWFDLRRRDGRWVVERVEMQPEGDGPPRAMLSDSLGIADLFVQAVLRQDFDLAHEFVDSKQVSDAKIAGLCILFEEGNYRLRPQKPLRKLFEREDVAGFLAYIEASDGSQAGQFGLTLGQPDPQQRWRVNEINLDSLIEDYARRFAGGDVFYTPLVPNPKGGDTLVLYFGFDKDGLDERTTRQLGIVARILRSDTAKKIVVSGYTDAKGSEEYNRSLSGRRAKTVREFLIAAGVPAEQIVTEAKGKSEPRRPNALEDGRDNPLGRRANRRSEIYLDF